MYIKELHARDDHEVYINCKAGHAQLTSEEKAEKKVWEQKHPGQKYPVNWCLSLDYYASKNDDSSDKQAFLEDTKYGIEPEISLEVERLRKVVETFTPRQKDVYKLVVLEEYSLTDAACELDISVPCVHKHMQNIIVKIKKYY